MLSYLQLPEVVTVDPYTQRPRTRFTRRLDSSQKNVINTMPPEVLVEIFLKLLEDDDMELHHSIRPLVSRACHSDPLLFGRVCSYWRSVALDTPKLWSRIYILKPQRCHIRFTRLWLERARTHPLDLSIWAPDVEEFDQSAASDIMSLFLERQQYWMAVSFTIEIHALKVFSQVAQSEPSLLLLESATLWISEPNDKRDELEPTLDDVWKIIHACKALRYVDWRSFYRHILPEHCPWDQLTGLTLSSALSVNQLLGILSVAHELRFLRLHGLSSFAPDSSEISAPIIHPRLKTLDITSNQETGPLFRLLSLPALQTLKMRNKFRKDVLRDVIGLQEFLKRSKSRHLTNFELVDLRISENDLQRYLQCAGFSGLLRIMLYAEITDRIVRQLTSMDSKGCHEVFPSLEVLDISSDMLQTTDGNLSTMVSSRFPPLNVRGRLRKMGLSMSNLGPIDQMAFSNMFERGLEGRKKTGYVDIRYM